MKIINEPLKKPKDKDGNKLIDSDPDDIFSEDNSCFRKVETWYSFIFFYVTVSFFQRLTDSKTNFTDSMPLYSQLFAMLYLVVNGLKSCVKKYIVLFLIGILMQVQIFFFMNEYIIFFQKDNNIIDDISSIISSISIEATFLILVFTFIVQFSNFMIFCIYGKKNETNEKKVKHLEIYLMLNFTVLLLSFAFSLVTPLYRFASVFIYPQLFIQYYLIKNQFKTERMGVLKYFGYGVAMQIHTLLLMFVYRSNWNHDMFPNISFSSLSIFNAGITFLVNILNIVSLYCCRKERDIEAYLNHEHRKTTYIFGFNTCLLFWCGSFFMFELGSPFATVLLFLQFHAQFSLFSTRCYISYKPFLGLFGLAILLQFQSLLLVDEYVMCVKTVVSACKISWYDGMSTIFNQQTLIFVSIVLVFTFMFQTANFAIYVKYIKNKDEKEKLKKQRTIKVLFTLVLLVLVFALVWSLISKNFRFVSWVLVPQVFTQIYFVNVGFLAEYSRFEKVLSYGMASERIMYLITILYSLRPLMEEKLKEEASSLQEEASSLKEEASSSDSTLFAILFVTAITLFVQISNGISFYTHSKRNKKCTSNRNQNAFFPMFEDFFDCIESKKIEKLEADKTQFIP